jgi:hypothetical protein
MNCHEETKEGCVVGLYKDPDYKRNHAKRPRSRFSIQKAHAKERGIEFDLSFEDWWSLWEQSGQWDNRGRKPEQYCMARAKDHGAYTLGNVSIVQVGSNLDEQLASGKHVGRKLTGNAASSLFGLVDHMTQAAAGHKVGISQSQVARIINGTRGRRL